MESLEDYEKSILESPVLTQRGWAKFIHQPKAGIFVPAESAEIAEWIGEFVENFEYPLASNKILKGHLFEKPGICVVAESPWLKQSPYCGGSKGSKNILGVWDAKRDQSERATTGCTPVQKLLIFFVDDEHKLLHQHPIQITVSGMYGTMFNTLYSKFCKEMCGNDQVVGPKNMDDDRWKKYVDWMRSGKMRGPRDAAVRFYSCAFVFRPVFESSFANNSKGMRNAMRTCNTKDYEKASGKLLVAGRGQPNGDYNKIRNIYRECIGAYDHYKTKTDSKTEDVEPAANVSIKRCAVEDLDENFDLE